MANQTSPLLIDVHEPKDAEKLFSQSVAEVYRMALNSGGRADYWWCGADNHTVQIERKQWGEFLGEFDQMEEIIRRYMDNSDEMGLIIEGYVRPHPLGCEVLDIYHKSCRQVTVSKRNYAEVQAWLWRIDKLGITPYFSANWNATVIAVSAFYKNSQKEEHTTLRRYVKHKGQAWKPNPHIQNLINVVGGGIGQLRAEAAVEAFGTYWDIIHRSRDELAEVEGWGLKVADKFINALGRK